MHREQLIHVNKRETYQGRGFSFEGDYCSRCDHLYDGTEGDGTLLEQVKNYAISLKLKIDKHNSEIRELEKILQSIDAGVSDKFKQ